MHTSAGYQWLIDRYQLKAMPLAVSCRIDTSVRGREQRDIGAEHLLLFDARYQPENTLAAHIQFALRYEGVNLQVLALLFETTGEQELCQWLQANPASAFARRACYFYEWLTGHSLPIADVVPPKSRYVSALDPAQQFTATGRRSERFRILDNLPGNRHFCPLVRVTPFLQDMVAKNLRGKTRETLKHYDPDLLRRAAAYLYLKETQSSFEVEREKPSTSRAQRFADLLRQADTGEALTEERLVELQNAVVDPRFHEFTWRHQQNWVGKDLGYRQQIDFVPPRPEDVPELMQGLLEMAAFVRTADGDPVINAAAIAFGFVFIHPFMDGNGRIHRYLIHDVLANAGFTPRGIVLPVSAVILANLDTPDVPAQGNDVIYFRFFDGTAQAEFLYRALERTVEEDLQQEIDFLLGFDRAYTRLNDLLDWPDHSLELFIRVVHQNNGELSKNKRQSHFSWMRENEINQAVQAVRESFTGMQGGHG